MSYQLEEVFGELGISQYLDAFVDQGFDTWETILDITESDLDALGVKLGHRRKLQRRIANSRGLAPEASLVSPTRQSVEDARFDAQRNEVSRPENRESGTAVITKRKYRRHPKPDENAPERPPSAYVLFSNKMRDDLKGRNLTFTEIAKLVGENWQNLAPSEKEPFETQAQLAKEKYTHSLFEYKKTPEYRRYMVYLHEFKLKHYNQAQDKDGPKRVKISESGGGGPLLTSAADSSRRTSRSGSSEGPRGSEPPPSRQQRGVSSVSMTETRHSPPNPPSLRHVSADDSIRSPTAATIGTLPERRSMERSPISMTTSPRDTSLPHARNPSWSDVQRSEDLLGNQRHLPPLSDMFDHRTFVNGVSNPEIAGFPFPRHRGSGSPGPPPSLIGSESRTPSLRKEQSSAGSMSSGTSFSHPRTPIDGPLPIHALLSGGSVSGFETALGFPGGSISSDGKPFPLHHPDQPNGEPLVNGHTPVSYTSAQSFQPVVPGAQQHVSPAPLPSVGSAYPLPLPTSTSSTPRPRDGDAAALDGMSALLKAGEIVDRRPR